MYAPTRAEARQFFFETWIPERERTARYVITLDREGLQAEGAQLLSTLPFRDVLFRQREYQVFERPSPAAPSWPR